MSRALTMRASEVVTSYLVVVGVGIDTPHVDQFDSGPKAKNLEPVVHSIDNGNLEILEKEKSLSMEFSVAKLHDHKNIQKVTKHLSKHCKRVAKGIGILSENMLLCCDKRSNGIHFIEAPIQLGDKRRRALMDHTNCDTCNLDDESSIKGIDISSSVTVGSVVKQTRLEL
ncbi:conserved hypothetical protein [Ricinus communis]|uniref:Uncharacterized protein n=1 Tax=Ricinus communis TaxID=3988 RepID=B9RHP1_RICCO|nr:conserved hypothetical protein [Ricinus communis]